MKTGIIEIKGTKIKISLDREMVRGTKDDGGFLRNTFTTITISGVDENIPKKRARSNLRSDVERKPNCFTNNLYF